jgi:hypothetical protein
MKGENNPELKKSVGIWLIVSDGPMKGNILLQRRAKNETSLPYVCQPTWHGKVERGETLEEAIRREAIEELGGKFVEFFDFKLEQFDVEDFSYNGQKSTCYNFVGQISKKQCELIKLHNLSMPEFIPICRKDVPLIKPLGPGVDSEKEITLFKDQYQSLKKLISLRQNYCSALL